MADFGDADPEDAYDETDPPLVRFGVLRLWLASIALEQAKGDHDHVRVVTRIQEARWALGLLVGKLPKRQSEGQIAMAAWLDDLLYAEGP